jgi:hypothetical protein
VAVEYGSLPFDEGIAFFRGKDLVPTERWADVWRDAHDAGFMVAGATKADLLADLKGAVDKAISMGTTLAEFRRDFDAIVSRHGWTGWIGSDSEAGRAWRTKLIYQTNLRAAYQAGRWQQVQTGKNWRPYLIYRHSDLSIHPRPLHKSWDGLVVHVDDPWVKAHWPPNGWGCKCRMFSLAERDLRKMGKAGPDTPPNDGTYEWIDSVTGELHQVPKGIDPGWDYAPGATRVEQLGKELQRKIAKLPEEIGQELEKTLSNIPSPREVAVDYVLSNGLRLAGQAIEFAFAYDDQGVTLVRKQGGKSQVIFSAAEMDAMRSASGVVLVHNHPSSRSLSLADMDLAASINGEVQAIGHNRVAYSASRVDSARLNALYGLIDSEVTREFWALINAGRMTPQDAERLHHHVVNTALSKLGAVNYSVINGDLNEPSGIAEAIDAIVARQRI